MSDPVSLPDATNLPFVEALYARYASDPESVSPEWRRYFDALPKDAFAATPRLGPSFRSTSVFDPPGRNGATQSSDVARFADLQDRVDQLIRAYRVRGHLIANVDPLGLTVRSFPELEPAYYGLEERHFDQPFSSRTIKGSPGTMTLREIVEHLRATYCRSIGVQFMHIDDVRIKTWLQRRMESSQNRLTLSRDEQRRIYAKLTDAFLFETFIQRKYIGAKRFSLEGAESLIPLLDMTIERAGDAGVKEIVFAMAHRGRLNVLANIIGKSPRHIFWEFDDSDPKRYLGGGDVKYHLGHSGDWKTEGGETIHLSLCFNPSHLEFVSPVALGRLRAKQDRMGEGGREAGLAILIHGDAAFAGQGVVQETLNMSELTGYAVGGAIHVIVNNQLGFTTGPREGRSTLYASAPARMLQIPIFHVNGEDPEAVGQCVRLAFDFRQTFHRDVIIDMYGYRKHGHNEGDEPAFTQPVMYDAIRKRKSIRASYRKHLLKMEDLTEEEARAIEAERQQELEEHLSAARDPEYAARVDSLSGTWAGGYSGGPEKAHADVETAVPKATLASLIDKLTTLPDSFEAHPKLLRILSQRRDMATGERPVDWAVAEALAFASLATDGHRVRMSGQDSARGTFSHRHAVLYDTRDGTPYSPLQHVSDAQAPVEVINSPLSEIGVMGFEYGYSLDCPSGLVVWEAQFGDFCNVAQVIIDQFIVSAEDKWRRLSGLVLLLPHGFEGQGPEHSSARLERFLTLAAEDNIQIANPTTAAQYFHLLRRQVVRPWRKPLVVLTPKSLLRFTPAFSPLEDLAGGAFQRILPDPAANPKQTSLILMCSGKIAYDLEKAREEAKRTNVAILRVEQLYPLSDEAVLAALAPYTAGTLVRWVQEEPENSGAWRYLRVRFLESILNRHPFEGVYRDASASPATGSASSHRYEQERLIEQAFATETA